MQSARIVITAPLTEIIDHAGYFIQMSMASLPVWLEGILDRKYPRWRQLERNADGSARYMPAGARVLETSLLQRFPANDVVCCYPNDLDRFIGPETRVVAISTHNPIGVTFAAGVYTSIFGSASQPINSHYAREMFGTVKANPLRDRFKVIVGGSGGWQVVQTNAWDELSVDWPLFMFASALPERWMVRLGKLYGGMPLRIKTRRELLATIKPAQRRFIRPDTGDLPENWTEVA